MPANNDACCCDDPVEMRVIDGAVAQDEEAADDDNGGGDATDAMLDASPEYKEYERRCSLFAALVDTCQELPSFDIVQSRLGIEVAHSYLESCQAVEELGYHDHGYDIDFGGNSSAPTKGCPGRRRWTARQVRDAVGAVAMLADSGGDHDLAVHAYERHLWSVRGERQQQKAALRVQNQCAVRRARTLGIWFPHPQDAARWRADPRAGAAFLELVGRVKAAMRDEKCILQYVPRRRYRAHAIEEVACNVDNMHSYLQCLQRSEEADDDATAESEPMEIDAE